MRDEAGPAFLAGGGECGRLIAARDWSATPLGPLDAWPGSLCTATAILLRSPVPMVMLWGPEGVMLYNDAFAAFAGGRHPGQLGLPVREGWPEVAAFNDRVMQVGLAGGTLSFRDQELALHRHGRPEPAWMNLDCSPVPGEDGEPAGVLAVVVETTARVLAERRGAFLLALDERLRAAQTPREAMDAACEALGEALGAGRVTFFEVDEARGETRVSHEFRARGMPPAVGRYPLADLGPALDAYRTGEPLVVEDQRADPRTATLARSPAIVATGVRAALDVPILRGGALLGVLAVNHPEPRRWTDREVELARATAARLGAAFERARAEGALRQSEARYRQIVEGAEDFAIVTLDEGGTVTGWNTGAERITGWTGAEAVGRPGAMIFTPEDRAQGIPDHEMNRTQADGRALDERWHLRRDGSRFWGSGLMMRLEGPGSDRGDGYLKVFRDRTAEHEADSARRRADERFRVLFEAIDAGFCVVEVDLAAPDGQGGRRIDYRVVEANPAFFKQTGFPEAILGRWLREAAPALEEHWFETYGRVARTGEAARFEQGSPTLGRWFDVHAFRMAGPDASRVAILFNDISDRRRAEERLRELNDGLEAQVALRTAERDRVWQASRDLLGVADGEGVWRSVNPAWTRTLGWAPGEIVGRTSEWLEHPDDRAATRDEVARLAAGAATLAFENRFRAKDGGYRALSWTAVPVEGMLYCVARDVTPERERQAELERAQEALRQSQKMEAVGQLTGGLAHDFNNLLAGISGSLEMVEKRLGQGRADEVGRYVEAAQDAAARAAALTHRLLAFSRRQTLDPRPTDVRALVAGMEDLIRRSVGPGIELGVAMAEGLWATLVDPHQLENALLNLCLNARDAMPEGGRLTVEATNRALDGRAARARDLPPGHYVSLCVSDTGTGMAPAVAAQAFDPFFTTKPLGQGTGLGLSMVYGFARQSGGQARIHSEPGRGATVCLYLPRVLGEAAEAETERPPAPPSAGAEAGAGAGRTVLVVDDEPTVRMLVREVLEELGYGAVEAEDGPAGLAVLRSDARIDLLVTDVGLPGGMNGRQMADAGRLARPGLPVLFITGYAETAAVGHGHLEPGMHVITKPFNLDALARRIGELIAAA